MWQPASVLRKQPPAPDYVRSLVMKSYPMTSIIFKKFYICSEIMVLGKNTRLELRKPDYSVVSQMTHGNCPRLASPPTMKASLQSSRLQVYKGYQ